MTDKGKKKERGSRSRGTGDRVGKRKRKKEEVLVKITNKCSWTMNTSNMFYNKSAKMFWHSELNKIHGIKAKV